MIVIECVLMTVKECVSMTDEKMYIDDRRVCIAD